MSYRITRYLRSNVLGLVAIFLALSGISYAAGLARNSVKSKHIRDEQVKLVDLAPEAEGPRAYTLVTANGASGTNTVDETRSKGIADANVTRAAAGTYCLDNLGFTPRNAQATFDLVNSSNSTGHEIYVGIGDTSSCPGSSEDAVVYVDDTGNPLTPPGVDAPVYLALFE
jgi:hypothetical protein